VASGFLLKTALRDPGTIPGRDFLRQTQNRKIDVAHNIVSATAIETEALQLDDRTESESVQAQVLRDLRDVPSAEVNPL
jgi:hypothetical protein